MSAVKQFLVYEPFKRAARSALRGNYVSDLLFSLGAAAFEHSNKTRPYASKEFYRLAVNRIIKATRDIRKLELQYYR